MIKNSMASRLLSHAMEELDMAFYGRNSGIGFVYGNLGDLLRKVQFVGATHRPTLFQHGALKKDRVLRSEGIEQLKENVVRLQEMQNRLSFMLGELESLVKKSS